jgi:hypothetical protein
MSFYEILYSYSNRKHRLQNKMLNNPCKRNCHVINHYAIKPAILRDGAELIGFARPLEPA